MIQIYSLLWPKLLLKLELWARHGGTPLYSQRSGRLSCQDLEANLGYITWPCLKTNQNKMKNKTNCVINERLNCESIIKFSDSLCNVWIFYFSGSIVWSSCHFEHGVMIVTLTQVLSFFIIKWAYWFHFISPSALKFCDFYVYSCLHTFVFLIRLTHKCRKISLPKCYLLLLFSVKILYKSIRL